MPGTLFVVATPIGNLEDITFRAVRVLGEVDLIAAEDTRRTSKLLAHYRIQRPLTSYRQHNEARETARLLARLQAGASIALVSDAGTPGIADPGARLVRAALEAGCKVVPIPGPSALTAALSVAGLEAEQFVFMGFPPASGTARSRWFERLGQEDRPVVVFEAPHRFTRTWSELRHNLPNDQIIVLREISKINEQLVVESNTAADFPVRTIGEFVMVIDRKPKSIENSGPPPAEAARISDALRAAGFHKDEALQLTARALASTESSTKKAIKASKMSGK